MHAHSHFMDVPRTKLSFIQNSPKTTFKNFPWYIEFKNVIYSDMSEFFWIRD